MDKKVLECSSKGDKRFSAFYAKVAVFGTFDSIENHYQLSKRFVGEGGAVITPQKWEDAKRKEPSFFEVGGKKIPVYLLSQFYKLLWVKYLDANPELVQYAASFDEFSDMFQGKSINRQADAIRQYVKDGRGSIMAECEPLVRILAFGYVHQVTGDLLKSKEGIIAHQVNCLAVMGAGLAYHIRRLYPNVFNEYVALCNEHQRGRDLLGLCQLVETQESGRYVANLFGQHSCSSERMQTEYPALEQSLKALKKVAQMHSLSVGLPYQLGSGLAGGDWDVVKKMIERVFDDYPVTIYKLPGLD